MSGAPLAGVSSRSAALALLVALATPARAEGPKVAKLEAAKGTPGSLALARGEGFPDKTDDVEILIRATRCTVSAAVAQPAPAASAAPPKANGPAPLAPKSR